MIKTDTLDGLSDSELQAVIDRSKELLKQRDDARKAEALEKARTLLASVGLSLKDLNGKGKKTSKGPVYHGGHTYQHPTNKALVWQAKGKKPTWLVALEADGGKAVEVVG
jgi:hypothetical protein